MSNKIYEKYFVVDDGKYLLHVSKGWTVAFAKYVYEWPEEARRWEDEPAYCTGLYPCKNPVKVIRTVAQLLREYVYTYKPPYLYFSNGSKSKRTNVYRKLLLRFVKELPEYQFVEKQCEEDPERITFLFYRMPV